jgi:hypothetical protein
MEITKNTNLKKLHSLPCHQAGLAKGPSVKNHPVNVFSEIEYSTKSRSKNALWRVQALSCRVVCFPLLDELERYFPLLRGGRE